MVTRAFAMSLVVSVVCAWAASGAGAAQGDRSGPRSLESSKALTRLEPRALRRWPASFAGLWLRGGEVVIAFTDRGKDRVDRLGKRFPEPERLRSVKVDDSLAALRNVQNQMIADRPANPVTIADPGSPRRIPLVYDLNIDIRRNVVEAIVGQVVTQEIANAFAARYGEDVEVRQGLLAKPDACNSRLDCAPLLRSGLKTVSETGSGCTTSFNVYYPPYPQPGARAGLLTAGHCGIPDYDLGAGSFHNDVRYGEVVFDRWDGPLDFELHSVGDGFDSSSPFVYVNDAKKNGVIKRVSTYDGLPVNSEVCMSGQKSGRVCGKVMSKTFSPNHEAYPDDAHDYVQAKICTISGDSGAGVYSSYVPKGKTEKGKKGPEPRYTAVGILSGGHPCDVDGYYAQFGHIEFVLGAYPLSIIAIPF